MDFFRLRDLFRDGGLASSSVTPLSFIILGLRENLMIQYVM